MNEIDLRTPIHHPSTASRVFGSDAVVISPAENMVRMLNPVGSRIWQLTDGNNTVEDIAVTLTEEFEVELPHARQSVATFVEDLIGRNLMDWSQS
ncbi:MAG: PqqD family protein [Caldilineales bacterium]